MVITLIIIIALLLSAVIFIYWNASKSLKEIDYMIDCALNDTFSEKAFDESRLSRLEAKMNQFLLSGYTARKEINVEKDAIKTLVSDISHQTKTPISNILLYIQLLREDENLSTEAQEITRQIEIQSEKLDFLIQSLVMTSRLESGIITVAPKRNHVDDLIQNVKEQYTAISNEKNILLSAQCPEQISANFDFKWTVEGLSNIVDNAIKYTPPGGKIEISSQSYEMFVRIDVKDNGIGLSEDETSKIFKRFYRSPRVLDKKGVGIGLYLTRQILTKQGGYIKVSSVPDQGSVFSVFLSK